MGMQYINCLASKPIKELPRNVELAGKGFMADFNENNLTFLLGGLNYPQSYSGKLDK